jgi:hypothetical protein
LRADEERLSVFGVFCMELDQADGGERRESGEEIFGVVFGEVLAAVEIEHGVRILRRWMWRWVRWGKNRIAQLCAPADRSKRDSSTKRADVFTGVNAKKQRRLASVGMTEEL